MKKRLSTRVLSLVLVVALLAGMVVPVHATSPKSTVTFTQVDNSAVSVNPLKPSDDEQLHTMDEPLATEIVRVSIILNKASTIRAGFSTMDIADNRAAMVYRTVLKTEQADLVNRIKNDPKRVRDFSAVKGNSMVTLEDAKFALERLEIDPLGLDETDRKLLLALIDKFGGGPAGLETLAATINEDSNTI